MVLNNHTSYQQVNHALTNITTQKAKIQTSMEKLNRKTVTFFVIFPCQVKQSKNQDTVSLERMNRYRTSFTSYEEYTNSWAPI